MTAVVIANVVLDLFVITPVVSILLWGIISDKRAAASPAGQAAGTSHAKRTRPVVRQLEGALECAV